jgi:hypothetical protein
MKPIKRTHLFAILMVIFTCSGIFNLVSLHHFEPTMSPDSAATIRKEIFQVHSVLLAGLIGGLFAKPSKPQQQVKFAFAATMIGCCALWAIYMGAAWLGYPNEIGANGLNGLIDQFNDRATEFSSLVAAALAYLSNKA